VAINGLVALAKISRDMGVPLDPALAARSNKDLQLQEALPNQACLCVLMDLMMPVMDGFEATQLLRALGFTAPIIAVSGNAKREDMDRFLLCGGNSFLTKPFNLKDLTAALRLENV
jgi:CheY-like chemotaxis protein